MHLSLRRFINQKDLSNQLSNNSVCVFMIVHVMYISCTCRGHVMDMSCTCHVHLMYMRYERL